MKPDKYIKGIGAVLDVKKAIEMMEKAVPKVEARAEQALLAFDFRAFEWKERHGFLWLKVRSRRFSENRMPPEIERAVRIGWYEARTAVMKHINGDDILDNRWDAAWDSFCTKVAGPFLRAIMVRGMLENAKRVLESGAQYLVLSDEGLDSMANLSAWVPKDGAA